MSDDQDASETSDEKILREAKQRFHDAEAAWSEVKNASVDDTKFSLLGMQWAEDVNQARTRDGRPVYTINKMPAFGRQIVNDMRQNRPQIKVRPVDGVADPQVADILNGLIRHIEAASDADVAYDTAGECAVYGGIGFFRIDVDYEYDDSFDMGIFVRRIPNAQCVTWDAKSEAADSSDWRYAFLSEMMAKKDFEAKWPGKESSDFGDDPIDLGWLEEDMVRVSEYWTRDEVEREIYQLANGEIVDADAYKKLEDGVEELPEYQIVNKRTTKGYKVIQRLISGADVLKTTEWAGSYIPIVPVWGHEVNVDGKRYYQSLIRHVKDAQRIFNLFRSNAAELVSLAPKAPWLMPEDAFPDDANEAQKWGSANQINHQYLLYRGQNTPQRIPFAGMPAGHLNESAMAADDMKAILGLFDASLGAKSNETSGIAIRTRMAEGDVSTFHFIDNLNRAIRCAGRILIELIPHVYNKARVIRILGPDGKPGTVAINQPTQVKDERGQAIERVFDLTTGRYDVRVEAGPSYTTQRTETAEMLTQLISAAPQMAPILAPELLKMSDFHDADKLARMSATMMPPAARAVFDGTPPPEPGPPPEVQMEMAKAKAGFALAQEKAGIDAQLGRDKAQLEALLEQQRAGNQVEIEKIQAQADIQVMRDKAAAEMQLAREHAALEWELKREDAKIAQELKVATTLHAAAQPKQQATQ